MDFTTTNLDQSEYYSLELKSLEFAILIVLLVKFKYDASSRQDTVHNLGQEKTYELFTSYHTIQNMQIFGQKRFERREKVRKLAQ